MSKFKALIGIATVAVFALTAVQADAKKVTHAKKQTEQKKCTPYGDESAGTQMCGYTK